MLHGCIYALEATNKLQRRYLDIQEQGGNLRATIIQLKMQATMHH